MSVEMFTELEGRDEAAFLSVRGFDVEVERDEQRKYSFLVPRTPATEAARREFAEDESVQRFIQARRQLKAAMRLLP
ncbi:hypothetical protein [Geobacter sp.]|uniref:hypothetical protein n=1 Tax=Geobacter sp. TaxID=46610 RepID=UPI001ACC70FA|nr:hypothetical protein [Geobacter sp.]CAG1002018.1 hypothetical protein ANRL4_03228 [Anaerolineae bacterium]